MRVANVCVCVTKSRSALRQSDTQTHTHNANIFRYMYFRCGISSIVCVCVCLQLRIICVPLSLVCVPGLCVVVRLPRTLYLSLSLALLTRAADVWLNSITDATLSAHASVRQDEGTTTQAKICHLHKFNQSASPHCAGVLRALCM